MRIRLLLLLALAAVAAIVALELTTSGAAYLRHLTPAALLFVGAFFYGCAELVLHRRVRAGLGKCPELRRRYWFLAWTSHLLAFLALAVTVVTSGLDVDWSRAEPSSWWLGFWTFFLGVTLLRSWVFKKLMSVARSE